MRPSTILDGSPTGRPVTKRLCLTVSPSGPANVMTREISRTVFEYSPSKPEVFARQTSMVLREMDPRAADLGHRAASSSSTPSSRPVRSSSPIEED